MIDTIGAAINNHQENTESTSFGLGDYGWADDMIVGDPQINIQSTTLLGDSAFMEMRAIMATVNAIPGNLPVFDGKGYED
ncbi:hypothetical protein CR513_18706, partial [Mucuna pruriens]